jgi:hypothetical protein
MLLLMGSCCICVVALCLVGHAENKAILLMGRRPNGQGEGVKGQ